MLLLLKSDWNPVPDLVKSFVLQMYTPQDQQQLATLAAMTQAQAQAQLINNVRVNPQIPQIGGVPRVSTSPLLFSSTTFGGICCSWNSLAYSQHLIVQAL